MTCKVFPKSKILLLNCGNSLAQILSQSQLGEKPDKGNIVHYVNHLGLELRVLPDVIIRCKENGLSHQIGVFK